jgi:5-hydroxyisourate hydrolase
MPKLTTHVLDTMNGCPAAGMMVTLYRMEGPGAAVLLKQLRLDDDGRGTEPLLEGDALRRGVYRLVFGLAAYFRERGLSLPDPPFLDVVTLEFGISQAANYHVPLLASPWSYSTYRGS